MLISAEGGVERRAVVTAANKRNMTAERKDFMVFAFVAGVSRGSFACFRDDFGQLCVIVL
jgi:hypothetical protein